VLAIFFVLLEELIEEYDFYKVSLFESPILIPLKVAVSGLPLKAEGGCYANVFGLKGIEM